MIIIVSRYKNWVCSRRYDSVYYACVVLIFRSLPSAEKVICCCCMLRARDWAGYCFLLCSFGTGWVSSISPFSMTFCPCYGCTVSFGNTIQCGRYMMVSVYSSASFEGIEIRSSEQRVFGVFSISKFVVVRNYDFIVCMDYFWLVSVYGASGLCLAIFCRTDPRIYFSNIFLIIENII